MMVGRESESEWAAIRTPLPLYFGRGRGEEEQVEVRAAGAGGNLQQAKLAREQNSGAVKTTSKRSMMTWPRGGEGRQAAGRRAGRGTVPAWPL